MSADEVRDRVYEALMEFAKSDEDIANAVCTGFLLLAEWVAPDGDRWMTKVSGDHAGELTGARERMFSFEHAFHWKERDPEDETEEDDDE